MNDPPEESQRNAEGMTQETHGAAVHDTKYLSPSLFDPDWR
jgi:hypothetical protein